MKISGPKMLLHLEGLAVLAPAVGSKSVCTGGDFNT